jgi:hypothetical protein
MASNTPFQASCQREHLNFARHFNRLVLHNDRSEAGGRIQNLRFAHFVCAAHKVGMGRLFHEHQGIKRAPRSSKNDDSPE